MIDPEYVVPLLPLCHVEHLGGLETGMQAFQFDSRPNSFFFYKFKNLPEVGFIYFLFPASNPDGREMVKT
jgi:hypothetical protein